MGWVHEGSGMGLGYVHIRPSGCQECMAVNWENGALSRILVPTWELYTYHLYAQSRSI